MKLPILLAFVAVVVAGPDDYSRFENLDVDKVMASPRLFKGFADCILGLGKCTAEGSDFKKALPKGIETSCGDCSDKLKILMAKIISGTQEKYPKYWESMNQKFNPTGEHDEKIKEFVQKYKP